MKKRKLGHAEVERRLFEYPVVKSQAELLSSELERLRRSPDVHAQGYGEQPAQGSSPGDPVFNRLAEIEKYERAVAKLRRKTVPVEAMIAYLDAPDNGAELRQMGMLLSLLYFKRYTWREVARELSVSRSAFYRLRRRLLALAEQYFSELWQGFIASLKVGNKSGRNRDDSGNKNALCRVILSTSREAAEG